MPKKFLKHTKVGEPVYVNEVCKSFNDLGFSERYGMHCVLNHEEIDFIKHYLWADIYNILSGLGGIAMHVYIDTDHLDLKKLINELNDLFQIHR